MSRSGRPVVLAGLLCTAIPATASAGAPPSVPPPAEATAATPDAAAFEAMLQHPDSVEPFAYAQLASWLWQQGRRQQAVFWFYMFQARSRPWAEADRHGEGDGAAALRASLNEELGGVINGWVASDPTAWKAIVSRALSFEARLPLNAARPDAIDAAGWRALVARERADYDAAAHDSFAGLDPAAMAAQRSKAGLPNGPLRAAGPPLPDSWR